VSEGVLDRSLLVRGCRLHQVRTPRRESEDNRTFSARQSCWSSRSVIKRCRCVSEPGLERFEILDEVLLLPVGQVQVLVLVIVVDHVIERRKATVMVEPALVNLVHAPQGA
jgi:hypothetical protein